MIVIRCHECKRKYNWAGDAFCPHCGAFNQAKDYSFDRERIEVQLEEDDDPKVLFRRKKTATGHANNAPDHTSMGRKVTKKQEEVQKAQASGCLRKIIIAIVIWNIGMAVLGVLGNLLFTLF